MGRSEDEFEINTSTDVTTDEENDRASTDAGISDSSTESRGDSKVKVSPAHSHPLWPDVEKVTMEQLRYAQQGVGEGWELFEEDGEMKLYKREKEVDGLIQDTLKAVHIVKGVTGFEMTNYFFQPEFRFGWETTLDEMKILEKISDDVIIFHQIHKRVWPASQRDAVFWSHLRELPSSSGSPGAESTWMVCNRSLAKDHPGAPDKKGKYTRAFLTAVIVCETIVNAGKDDEPLTRDNVSCKISYCSHVDPGGWVPAAAVRAVYKREYPKFLKKFTGYVLEQAKNQPVRFR